MIFVYQPIKIIFNNFVLLKIIYIYIFYVQNGLIILQINYK